MLTTKGTKFLIGGVCTRGGAPHLPRHLLKCPATDTPVQRLVHAYIPTSCWHTGLPTHVHTLPTHLLARLPGLCVPQTLVA